MLKKRQQPSTYSSGAVFAGCANCANVLGLNGVFSRRRILAVRESRGRPSFTSTGGGSTASASSTTSPTAEPVDPSRGSVGRSGTVKRSGVFDESETGLISCWVPSGSAGGGAAATPMSSAPVKRMPFGFRSGFAAASCDWPAVSIVAGSSVADGRRVTGAGGRGEAAYIRLRGKAGRSAEMALFGHFRFGP